MVSVHLAFVTYVRSIIRVSRGVLLGTPVSTCHTTLSINLSLNRVKPAEASPNKLHDSRDNEYSPHADSCTALPPGPV